jgi:hypothetical protein
MRYLGLDLVGTAAAPWAGQPLSDAGTWKVIKPRFGDQFEPHDRPQRRFHEAHCDARFLA